MEIYNFPYGTKFKNADGLQTVNYFYGKNIGKLTLLREGQFGINDPLRYQTDLNFARTNITAIFDNGFVVPLPGTDELLYDLLCTYLYSPQSFVLDQNKTVAQITGPAFSPVLGNTGFVFLFDLPTANKTFTIPAGLPRGWNCEVVKMFAGGDITINGSGGMVVTGIDLILNNQWAKMQILVTSPTTAIAFNIGG